MKLWPFSKKTKTAADNHFELPPGVMLADPDEPSTLPDAFATTPLPTGQDLSTPAESQTPDIPPLPPSMLTTDHFVPPTEGTSISQASLYGASDPSASIGDFSAAPPEVRQDLPGFMAENHLTMLSSNTPQAPAQTKQADHSHLVDMLATPAMSGLHSGLDASLQPLNQTPQALQTTHTGTPTSQPAAAIPSGSTGATGPIGIANYPPPQPTTAFQPTPPVADMLASVSPATPTEAETALPDACLLPPSVTPPAMDLLSQADVFELPGMPTIKPARKEPETVAPIQHAPEAPVMAAAPAENLSSPDFISPTLSEPGSIETDPFHANDFFLGQAASVDTMKSLSGGNWDAMAAPDVSFDLSETSTQDLLASTLGGGLDTPLHPGITSDPLETSTDFTDLLSPHSLEPIGLEVSALEPAGLESLADSWTTPDDTTLRPTAWDQGVELSDAPFAIELTEASWSDPLEADQLSELATGFDAGLDTGLETDFHLAPLDLDLAAMPAQDPVLPDMTTDTTSLGPVSEPTSGLLGDSADDTTNDADLYVFGDDAPEYVAGSDSESYELGYYADPDDTGACFDLDAPVAKPTWDVPQNLSPSLPSLDDMDEMNALSMTDHGEASTLSEVSGIAEASPEHTFTLDSALENTWTDELTATDFGDTAGEWRPADSSAEDTLEATLELTRHLTEAASAELQPQHDFETPVLDEAADHLPQPALSPPQPPVQRVEAHTTEQKPRHFAQAPQTQNAPTKPSPSRKTNGFNLEARPHVRRSAVDALDDLEQTLIWEESRFVKRSIDDLVSRYFAQSDDNSVW